MNLPLTLGLAALLLVAVTILMILTSRAAIEKLVNAGVLPRVFTNFVPAMTLTARSLAVILIVVGLIQLGITTGVLASSWIEKYGFPALLILFGAILLGLVGWRHESR